MEFQQLRTFQAVAKFLSFNRAAEYLHYAQSTISAQIQALEEDLGVRLFDRLGRRILLTAAGTHLLQYAEKILDLIEETQAEVKGAKEPQGSLVIRIPETLGAYRLPPVIKEFQSRFPKVRLHFTTCAHDDLPRDLRKGITDLAFLLAESIQAADLQEEALGFESLVLVAHPDHPLAAQSLVHTRELGKEALLLSKVDCSYRKIFEQILSQENVRPVSILEFNSLAAIKQCILEGIGITIIPEIAVRKDIEEKRLVPLAWSEGKLEVAILMIWHKDKWLSPSLKAFMEMARKVMGPPNKG